ncbi:EF-hand domain-containing protein [Trichostrongylus colubriformis]|uniref:EF-hand domain-containing protein n=1 Tax=Trichostrongylus colubriformis TaxID=6319 RepID=A0AAN8IGA7_TRICO
MVRPMHQDGAITDLVLNRILSRAVRTARKDTMSLIDFTNSLLAEENKTHPTSLEYWFRVLDEDGDGQIPVYEMEQFHQPVIAKLTEECIDSMSFKDVTCQMFDMICPVNAEGDGKLVLDQIRQIMEAEKMAKASKGYDNVDFDLDDVGDDKPAPK